MKRLGLLVLTLAGVALGAVALLTTGTEAATPPSQTVTAPTTPGAVPVTVEWQGDIPPVSDGEGTSSCKDRLAGVDPEAIHITVPAGAYDSVDIDYKFSITWDDASNDEVLTVVNKDVADQGSGNDQEGTQSSEVGSSDTSATTEQVVAANLPTGNYEAQACPFLATTPTPQHYTGELHITAKAKEPDVPAADAGGLSFSASVPADPQRDSGEPLMEIDKAGNSYTCGPSGFSNAAEYAQVSTDGGDQFHLLGEPPRGQIGLGGGGDCSIATAPDRNGSNQFDLAYTGLGPLTNFTASRSSDTGHTFQSSPVSGLTIPGVDRQWQVFLDADSVLLNYNQQAPRRVVVQRSDNGGLAYGQPADASAANPSFPGPMRSLPARFNPTGAANGRVAYFPWTKGTNVNLSVSFDGGTK